MKRHISYVVAVSLFVSNIAAQGMSNDVQSYINEINAQYKASLQAVELQRQQQLQRLAEQYEEAARITRLQLADTQSAIRQNFEPKLATASSSVAADLSKKMNEENKKAQHIAQNNLNALRRVFEQSKHEVKKTVDSAKKSLEDQARLYKGDAKGAGQAATDAAVSSFASFTQGLQSRLNTVIVKTQPMLASTQNSFMHHVKKALPSINIVPSLREKVSQVGAALAQKASQIRSAVGNKLADLKDSMSDKLALINNALATGKDKLVQQISNLKDSGSAIKSDLESSQAKPLTEKQRAALKDKLKRLGVNIAGLGTMGPVVPVQYQAAQSQSIASSMYQKAKQALSAPIRKVSAAWKGFMAKMDCLGNPDCSDEQRKQAGVAFLKVYYVIQALAVAALFGVALTTAVQEERTIAERETGLSMNAPSSIAGQHSKAQFVPIQEKTIEEEQYSKMVDLPE